jgi:hypothetical protein
VGFLVLPILSPALLEGCGLRLLRDAGDKVGVADGDALLGERFGHFGDELQERQTGVDVACALARLLNQRGNVVAGDVEQPLKSFGFFVRMHVNAHRVFDLSLVLQKL